MTIALFAQLAVLALIDSTSIGTLLIPFWLLLRPDARRMAPRILLYLGALAGFYLLVGIGVLAGAGWLAKGLDVDSLLAIPPILWTLTLGGGAMLAYALFSDLGSKSTGSKSQEAVAQTKWASRIATALRSPGGLVTLALIAGLLELPTMLPYLAAIGLLTNSDLPLPTELGVLGIYCVLMLIPALVLVALRVALGSHMDAGLRRLSPKLGKFASETLVWVVGIVGFLLLRAGLAELAPMASWNPFK
ncbi:GAP family protein [Arthrobacter antibioticus]|uniref:GAP family protein n=1 Tax=Arthrobacter sp. H35-MC1 TaxID=3046203 RepID=UPI0024B8EA0A|nr:GAP family protein [Arthrobacter sp. H35-MC1]MDJ0317261.1 GAP family protein [Arthrobacter sp. H35-MC1]